ncbi:hypothetical protein J7F01_06845 [Streptomyces sp. ISL-22]|uniref:Uncharacterized protein n=1 Tax=Streptomyces curacoi TaxID=146536 RepID=A0A117PK34_9ACTN|nr:MULTISPECIES: hypothetical protein [Streptomyces]KUM81085.1 hypothetical protein AQI70_03590 [Streptomyces curacoi]MBT2422593.1 hypothetical protein [Streptomyces sp. ISL-24]MBT2431918.1 hypothetical protein [Streptomyces sp. ISL-22]
MATIPSLPSRDDVLRMARSTTDITGQLLETAGNLTRIAINTFDPRDGSGAEVLRVLRRTTAELAEASASPQAQEAFYRIVETLTRLGTSGAPLAVHPVSEPAQALLTALGESLLPVLDAVEPAVEEFAAALGELVEATSPLLPATAGVAAGALLAVTPLLRSAADVLRESSPELSRIADALTAALAPLMPLQVALAERTAAAGANVVRAALPPLADLTEAAAATTKAARPVLIAGEELLVSALEQVQPLLLAGAARTGRVARAVAVRVSAAVSPAAEQGVVVAVSPA